MVAQANVGAPNGQARVKRTGAIKFKITCEVDGKPMVAHLSKLHQYGVVLKKTLLIDVGTLNGEHGTLFFFL